MAAEFVPFLPTIRSQMGAASSATSDTAFSPVQTATETTHTVKACAPPGELKVDLKREGDRITQIRIQCRCGELIELDCEY
jgi:hypothetical protein